MTDSAENRIANLPCWKNPVRIEALSGGMTNLNFKVEDGDQSYVVRFGEDDPVHLISRSNEIASCEAAFAIGVSPELVYNEPGILVARFIEGRVFDEADVREDNNLLRIIELLKRFHREVPMNFNQIPVMFWVFQVLRHYQNLLGNGESAHKALLPELARIGRELETAVGPVEIDIFWAFQGVGQNCDTFGVDLGKSATYCKAPGLTGLYVTQDTGHQAGDELGVAPQNSEFTLFSRHYDGFNIVFEDSAIRGQQSE